MALDYVGFINQNTSLNAAKKQAFLDDFCEQYNYQDQIEDDDLNLIPNPVTKKDFANEKIDRFLRETVNVIRRKRVEKATTFEELQL